MILLHNEPEVSLGSMVPEHSKAHNAGYQFLISSQDRLVFRAPRPPVFMGREVVENNKQQSTIDR